MEWLWASIIGIVGTLLGTVLGWILGRLNNGKLFIQINSLYDINECRIGRDVYIGNDRDGELDYYSFCFIIQLYNSSEKNIILRELQVAFYDLNNKELFREDVNDLDTWHNNNGRCHIDKVGVINISPATGMDLKSRIGTRKIEDLFHTYKLKLIYKDKKFKEKVIVMPETKFYELPRKIEIKK